MIEIRIEKVTNGYIVRCIDCNDENRDDTYVYSSFPDVVAFVASEMKEEIEFN